MPLHQGAEQLIRKNLEACSRGEKPALAVIGTLSQTQLDVINADRAARDFPPIIREVVFRGTHIHKSRCGEDGYTIEDVIRQITSAMDEASEPHPAVKMTTMKNPTARDDGYGNAVFDEVVFECSSRYPQPEYSQLFSVIPRGDKHRPSAAASKRRGRCDATPASKLLTDSSG